MKGQAPKPLPLRPRQADAILWLIDQMDTAGQREAGLSGQPGFGKSIANQVINTSLHNRGRVRLTVTLAPQILIEDSLRPQRDILWSFPDNAAPPVTVRRSAWSALRETAHGRDILRAALRSCRPTYPHLVTTYQAMTRWLADDPDLLPRNLLDVSFSFDEAHHVSESNQFGDVVRQIQERNAFRLFISATLYRHTGQILIDTTRCPVFTVSVADAMADPDKFRYCPKALDQRMRLVPAGQEPPADRIDTCVVEDMEREGWPKTILILQPGDAEGKAERLKQKILLRNPKLRVLNMIGNDTQSLARAKDLLVRERTTNRYRDSKIDIIMACGRFKEGDDWPMASHIYILWLSDSIPQLVQWFGRVLRSKRAIRGYPKKWRDLSVATQIVSREPSSDEDVKEGHVDRTFLTAAIMADSKVARDYLRDELRFRVEQKRSRSGQENPESWVTLAQAINCTIEETRQSLGLLAKAQASLAIDDGFKPSEYTNGRIRDKLRTMRLTDGERERTHRCLDMKVAQTLPTAAKNVLRRMEKEILGPQKSNWRWVHEALQACFAQVAAAHEDCVIPDIASPGRALVTEMTGWTAQEISKSLLNWLPWERMFALIEQFHQEHQHTVFGEKDQHLANWVDRQRALYRNNQLAEDRQDRLTRLGIDLVRSWSNADQEAELIRQCLADPNWIPCVQDTRQGLGLFARDLRVNGTDARRDRVREQVPWFEWDNGLAEFRRGMADHGEAILVAGSAAYRWYEPYHLEYRTGTLAEPFTQRLKQAGKDASYHKVYQQVWKERERKLRNVPFSLAAFLDIWDEAHLSGRPELTLLFRITDDTLMDFERTSVFHDGAFQPLLALILKDGAMERLLQRCRSEKNIRQNSLLGRWWQALDEAKRSYHRVRWFNG